MTLAKEITGDPLGLGYAGMTDQQVADSLNTMDRERNRPSMAGSEVAANIDPLEWGILPDADQRKVLALLGIDNLDPFGFAKNIIVDAFGAGSVTVAALAAARVETISRATELGIRVGPGLVAEARR